MKVTVYECFLGPSLGNAVAQLLEPFPEPQVTQTSGKTLKHETSSFDVEAPEGSILKRDVAGAMCLETPMGSVRRDLTANEVAAFARYNDHGFSLKAE